MRILIAIFCTLVWALAPATALPKADFIVVEKAKRVLTLYAKRKPIKTYRIALGGSPEGHKEQEGDSRTPEGRYKIDGKNPGSAFHLSLRISYPNVKDRAQARAKGVSPGGWIMIHGTPDYLAAFYGLGVIPDWTAGCIAVTNGEIEEIYRAVPVGTPIVIKP